MDMTSAEEIIEDMEREGHDVAAMIAGLEDGAALKILEEQGYTQDDIEEAHAILTARRNAARALRAIPSAKRSETSRVNGAKGGKPKDEPGEYEYTVEVNGQDGRWEAAPSLQAAKLKARKEAKEYGSLAREALIAKKLDDGQSVIVYTLESDGYNWAGRGTWRQNA